MSDWRSRAKPVEVGWKSRAAAVAADPTDPAAPGSRWKEADADSPAGAEDMPPSGLTQPAKQPLFGEVPDAILEELGDPNSTTGAAFTGLKQGASYGMADEAEGALGAALFRDEGEGFVDAYRKDRDAGRLTQQKAAEAHPVANLAGAVGGAIIAPGPKAKAAKGVVGAAKQGGLMGLKTGAIAGAGMSDADLTSGRLKDYGKFLVDSAGGSLLGGAGGALLGGAMGKLNPYIEKLAQRRAYKALDPYMNSIKRDMAGELPENVMRKMEGLGKRALDDKVIPEGPLERFATSETLASRAAGLRDQAGQVKGALVDMAQDQMGGRPVSMVAMAKKLQAQAAELAKSPATATTARKLEAQAEEMLRAAEKRTLAGEGYRMTLPEAEKLKTAMQAEANYNIPLAQRGGAAETAKKLAASTARKASEDAIEGGLGPDELAIFKAAKARYGDLDKLADTSGYGAARQFRNNLLGLDDKVAATSAPETGNGLIDSFSKAGFAFANKLLKQRGSSGAARGLRNLSESTASIPMTARMPSTLEAYRRLLDEEEP